MATFVLIHGAGDVGWHLAEAELRASGHQTVAPDLPCDNNAATLDDYVAAVTEAADGRQDLVIVSQSYGAFTATLAASRLPACGRRRDRKRRPAHCLLQRGATGTGGAGAAPGRARRIRRGL